MAKQKRSSNNKKCPNVNDCPCSTCLLFTRDFVFSATTAPIYCWSHSWQLLLSLSDQLLAEWPIGQHFVKVLLFLSPPKDPVADAAPKPSAPATTWPQVVGRVNQQKMQKLNISRLKSWSINRPTSLRKEINVQFRAVYSRNWKLAKIGKTIQESASSFKLVIYFTI